MAEDGGKGEKKVESPRYRERRYRRAGCPACTARVSCFSHRANHSPLRSLPVSPGSPASPASPVFSLALSLHPLPPLQRHCERACRKSSPVPPSPHLSPLFIYSFFRPLFPSLPDLIVLFALFRRLFPPSLSSLPRNQCDSLLANRTSLPTHPERWYPSPSSIPVSSHSLHVPRRELKAQARPSSSPATKRRERRISCRARFTRRNIVRKERPRGAHPRRRGRRSFPYSRAFSRTWMERRGIEMRSSTYRATLHGASRFEEEKEEGKAMFLPNFLPLPGFDEERKSWG